MPPFQVSIEVLSKQGEADPTSVNKLRELRASGIPGSESVSSLRQNQMINFVINCASKEEAASQAQDLCDKILVNPVLATAEITIEELSI